MKKLIKIRKLLIGILVIIYGVSLNISPLLSKQVYAESITAKKNKSNIEKVNQDIKFNVSKAKDRAESFYTSEVLTNRSSMCSDKTVKMYLSRASQLSGKPYVCKSATYTWSISVPLKSAPASSWCTDTDGYTGLGVAVSIDENSHVCDVGNAKDLSAEYSKGLIKKVSDMPKPSIFWLEDNTSALSKNQYIPGDKISLIGLNFGTQLKPLSGWVYVDGKFNMNFAGGSTNSIDLITENMAAGSHKLYFIDELGRKSNTINIYGLAPIATKASPASVEIKINGSENVTSLPYGSKFNFSWSSSGTRGVCNIFGYGIEKVGGTNTEADSINLNRSGSAEYYAKSDALPNQSSLQIGVQCDTTTGKQAMKQFDILVTR